MRASEKEMTGNYSAMTNRLENYSKYENSAPCGYYCACQKFGQ